MSVIQSSIAGLSRSEQQEAALNRLNQSVQNAGAAIEQRKQWSVEQGLKNVLGDMPISVMASTMDGQRAMAPYVSAFTGLRGQALQDYLNNLALMPKDITAEQLIAQQYVLHGRNTQGIEAAQSEEDFLRQNASYSKPTQPAQPAQASAQPAPAPAPASAPGGLNEYELKAVAGEAGRRIREKYTVQAWTLPGSTHTVYYALPKTAAPTRDPLGGPPEGAIIGDSEQEILEKMRKEEEAQVLSELTRGGPTAEILWRRINEQATTHLMAEKDDMKRAIPADTAGYQGAPPVGRTYAEAYGQQASGSAKPAPLPTVGSPKPGGGVYNAADINALRTQQEAGQNTGVRGAAANLSPDMTFRQFLIARQNSGVPYEWTPVGEKGAMSDAELMRANGPLAEQYQAYKASGTVPSWATGTAAPPTVAPRTSATTGGTGATTPADDLIQRYYMSTYNKSSYQGPPLSAQETAQAKRLVAQQMAEVEGNFRRTWRANPNLQGIEARLAQENVYMLEHVAPGARKEDHPFLSTLYTDWSGLAERKMEADIRALNAEAGMNEVQARYFLETKKMEAASSILEQMAAVDEAFAKQMASAIDLLNSEAVKPFYDRIKAIKDPDAQVGEFLKLADELPVLKTALNMAIQGGSAMMGVEIKGEVKKWFTGGFLGIGKTENTASGPTPGDLTLAGGDASDATRLAAEYLATFGQQ